MKIAFLSFYNGEIERGVEVYVDALANQLSTLGHQVVVFQNGPSKSKKLYKVISLGLPIDWAQKSTQGERQILPDYWSKLVGKFTKKALEAIEEDTDILVPTNGSLQSLYSKLWCMKHKSKLVISGQSGPGWDDRWNLYMFPDVFIALTKESAKWVKKANPFVKVEVISNGVNLSKFKRKKTNLFENLEKPVVLTVGALAREKRQDLAIKAVAKLHKGSLVVVGKGPEKKKLERLGIDLLSSRRFLIIESPHEKMPEVYQSADLFTYPTSPSESFGIVLAEAMASGLAVVATDDPIRREIVSKAGLFVNPTDSDKYAESLNMALKTDWKDKSTKQALSFSWDKISLQYEKLFESLVRK